MFPRTDGSEEVCLGRVRTRACMHRAAKPAVGLDLNPKCLLLKRAAGPCREAKRSGMIPAWSASLQPSWPRGPCSQPQTPSMPWPSCSSMLELPGRRWPRQDPPPGISTEGLPGVETCGAGEFVICWQPCGIMSAAAAMPAPGQARGEDHHCAGSELRLHRDAAEACNPRQLGGCPRGFTDM